MKSILFIIIACSLLIACGADPSQTAFPKQLPVDNRAEQQEVAENKELQKLEQLITIYNSQKEQIQADLTNGNLTTYAVRDGDPAAFVAESTTYYQDDEKTLPSLTKIIYLSGGFANVYWLKDEMVWIHKDDYDHLLQKGALVASFQDGTTIELTEQDKEAVLKILPLALNIITSPLPTEE